MLPRCSWHIERPRQRPLSLWERARVGAALLEPRDVQRRLPGSHPPNDVPVEVLVREEAEHSSAGGLTLQQALSELVWRKPSLGLGADLRSGLAPILEIGIDVGLVPQV